MEYSNSQQISISQTLLKHSITYITDEKGIIISLSDNLCHLSGYTKNELLGKKYFYFYKNPNDHSLHDIIISTIKTDHIWKGESHNTRKDGTSYWVESSVTKLSIEDNNSVQYLHIINDISHKKALINSINKRASKQSLLNMISQLSLMGYNNIQLLLEQTIASVTGSLDMYCGMAYNISDTKTEANLCAQASPTHLENSRIYLRSDKNNLINFILQSEDAILIDFHNENRFQIDLLFKNQNCRYCLCKRIGKKDNAHHIFLLFSDNYNEIRADDAHFLQNIDNILSETIILKKISDQLVDEKKLFKKYIDISNVIIIVFDMQGNIRLANKKSATSLGYEQQQLIGMNWFNNFIQEDMIAEKKKHFNEMNENKNLDELPEHLKTSLAHIKTRSGEKRLIKWNNAILKDNSDRLYSIIGIGEDITEIERIKKEKKQLQIDLSQAQKMEALGQLTGGIAHDFNNILAGILGFSQLAIEHNNKNEANIDLKLKDHLEEIESASKRGKNLISQMLSYSQVRNNELQHVALPSLVKSTLKMLRSTIPSSMTFNIIIDDNISPVIADPSNLNQVIMNLLLNARDVLKNKGTITVSVSEYKMESNLCASCNKTFTGHYINLSVYDSGSGIKKSDLPLIFNEDFTSKEENNGFGKSLASVHEIVHNSNGHIVIETSSEGTTFNILFEIATGSLKTKNSLSAPAKPINTDKHIMIVDDENTIAKYLEELFIQCGYKVSLFTDPTLAFSAFENNPFDYDLLLTDQTMPIITGAELAKKMMHINADLPVVICTGYSDLIDEEKAAKMNIKGFLRKPVETHELLECIYTLLED